MQRRGGFFLLLGLAIALSIVGIGQIGSGQAQDATPQGEMSFNRDGFGERSVARTESLGRESGKHLTLYRFTLEPDGTLLAKPYGGTQILVVDDGAMKIEITDLGDGTTGLVTQTDPTGPCAGGCQLDEAARLSREGAGLVLTFDSTLSHDGDITYSLTDVEDPTQAAYRSTVWQGRGSRGLRACASGC